MCCVSTPLFPTSGAAAARPGLLSELFLAKLSVTRPIECRSRSKPSVLEAPERTYRDADPPSTLASVASWCASADAIPSPDWSVVEAVAVRNTFFAESEGSAKDCMLFCENDLETLSPETVKDDVCVPTVSSSSAVYAASSFTCVLSALIAPSLMLTK